MIYNAGTATIASSQFTGNTAPAAGAIFNGDNATMTLTTSTLSTNAAVQGGGALVVGGGTVRIERSQILSNTATGTVGAAGQPRKDGNPATHGEDGGSAFGGGIAVTAGSLVVFETTIAGNIAAGGRGGNGVHEVKGNRGRQGLSPAGTGQAGWPGSDGTNGGKGGSGLGGGIYVQAGTLFLVASTVSENQAVGAVGGDGGSGGEGGNGGMGGLPLEINFFSLGENPGGDGGAGGDGGNGGNAGAGGDALGGAIYLAGTNVSVVIANATIAGNAIQAGNGSKGGDGGVGGRGGNGMQGTAPLLELAGFGGPGGNGGDGGMNGPAGNASGAGIYRAESLVFMNNTTIAYNGATKGQTVTAVPLAGNGGSFGANALNRPGTIAFGSPGQPGSLSVIPLTTGGGLSTQGSTASFSASNSIIAMNTADGRPSDVAGELSAQLNRHNLFGTGGSGGLLPGELGNQVGVADPGILPLADNGGHTRTIALRRNSPAMNAGRNDYATAGMVIPLITDQRGAGFTRIADGTVDIGAYEFPQIVESLVVTTLADEDDQTSDARFGTGTSLREAIAWANQNPGADTITFDPSLTGTITLTLGQLVITGSTGIVGPGASRLTVSGNDSSRIFLVSNFIEKNLIDVSLEGLTLTRGIAPFEGGGAIYSRENLTLTRMMITGNRAPIGQEIAGGVFHSGSFGTMLRVIDSTFSDNSAGFGAGALLILKGESNGPRAEIIGSTFTGNSVVHIESTLGAGAVYSDVPLTVTNSTFSGNRTTGKGSAIYVSQTSLTLTHVTVVGNTSPFNAIYGINRSGIPNLRMTLANSILAGNTGAPITAEVGMIFRAVGANILQGGLPIVGIIDADPMLGPLADNGGLTLTHRPAWNSPATNAGAPIGGPTTDQRGRLRSSTTPTLGAVEGPSIRINSPSIDLGTTVYGQSGPAASFEIEAYGLDRATSFDDFLQVSAIAAPFRPTEWDYSLDGTNWLSSIEEWPGGSFEFSPDEFLTNPRKTIYVRLLKGATAGSTYGNFIVRSDLDGAGAIRYLPYTGVINPATLTFTADPARRTYGEANPVLSGSLTGFLFEDTLESELVDPEDNPPTITSPATSASGAGQYPIVGSYLLKNYVVAQAPANDTALTIDRRELVVRGVSTSKIQGEANPAFAVNYSGFVLNDGPGSLGGSLAFSTAATASSLPGSYLFTPGGLASNNYDIRFVSGGLTVLSYSQSTATLLDQVNATAMRSTLRLSLAGTLNLAIQAFDTGDTVTGMNHLGVFIDTLLRSDRSLSPTLAQNWIAYARRIRRAWNPNL